MNNINSKHIFIPTLSLNSTRSTIEPTSRNQFENFKIRVNSSQVNDSYDEIYQSIFPQLERLKQKEEEVNGILKEATKYCDEYKHRRNETDDEGRRIEGKKEKLKYVYHSLYQFKQNLLKKEEELKEREKALILYEESLKKNEEINKVNSMKFEDYVKEKGEELKQMANSIKEIKEKNEVTNIELLKREQELQLRENKLIIDEDNLRNQLKSKSNNNNQIPNLNNNENIILNTNNIPHKENEIVIEESNNIISNNKEQEDKEEIEKKAMLIRLDEEINSKKEELMRIDNEVNLTNKLINNKLDELNERLQNVIQREKEINLLKFTLEDKLNYVNQKLKLTYEITSDKK